MPASPKPTCLAEAFAAVAEAQKANDAASAAWLAAVAAGDRIAFAPETKAALAAARDAVPIPAALIVPPSTVRTVMVQQQADGSEKTHNIEHRPWLPRCPADVHEHCAGDKAKRDEMLAALRTYQGAVEAAKAKAVPALAKARRAERKLDRAADVARGKLQVAADRLARIPASTPEEALAKVTAVLHAYGSGLDKRGNVITGMRVDLPDVEPPHAIRAVFSEDRVPWVGEAEMAGEAGARSRWEAAVAAFEEAKAADRANCEVGDAASRRIVDGLPPAAVLRHGQPSACPRWTSLTAFDHDHSPEEEALRPVLAESFERLSEDIAVRDQSFARDEALYDALFAAEVALMETPAPDLAAVALKSALLAVSDDDDKHGFDDLGWVCDQLHGFYPEKVRVLIHRDLLRLSTVDHPALHEGDWNPRSWMAEFEQGKAGVVSAGLASTGDELFFGVAHDATPEEKARLFAAMHNLITVEPSWKHRALELAADRRRAGGGDPIQFSDGSRRPAPLGQGWRGPYVDWRTAIDADIAAEAAATQSERAADQVAA